MPDIVNSSIFDSAISEMRRRSKLSLYQRDFDAWNWDILRMRDYKKIREIAHDSLFADIQRTLTKSGNGVGKAESSSSLVPTPGGWARFGNLKSGDELFDEKGEVTTIVGLTQVWKDERVYRVTFDDGTFLDAGEHHEWRVMDHRRRRLITPTKEAPPTDWRDKWDSLITVETGEMFREPKTLNGMNRWRVPLAGALQLPRVELPIDPYVLGLWLADGASNNGTITYGKTKIGAIVEVERRGYEVIGFDAAADAELSHKTRTIRGIVPTLRALGVLGNKHIPVAYLRASESQRRDLLAGLLDGDGFTVNADGVVGIDLTRKVLHQGVVELVRTLGYKVFTSEGVAAYTLDGMRHVTGTRYRANFRPNVNPFMAREIAFKFKPTASTQQSRHTQRTIVSIEYVGTEDMFCIEVDSPRHLYLSGEGMVPTHNSSLMARLVLWAGSVFPEGETVSIISAPSIPQLQKVTFAYLKSYHGRVSKTLSAADFRIPGRIDENLGWVSETKNGKIWLASGRKPPDQDAVSMFQGLRSQIGMTYVWFDEAGGMGRAMFTAAEAVMTGADSRFGGIGNPDNASADWQASFTDKDKAREYNLHTISAFDTPVYTGERVYPHTREGEIMEAQLLRALTSKQWVAHKSRIWATGGEVVPDPQHPEERSYDMRVDKTELFVPGKIDQLGKEFTHDRLGRKVIVTSEVKWDARGLSKVLGEFPGDNDTAFFPQDLINLAHATTIRQDDGIRPVLGVDVARFGADESVVFMNRGGRARILDSWGKSDTVESARRIHRLANENATAEVRIDASGIGGGVYDMLNTLEEFSDKVYVLIGVDGGTRSSDNRRWLNARAENHDQLRELMATRKIDLDYDDRELTDQLVNLTYKFTNRGGIQITPKDEMRTVMEGSPDRLDALIYSVLDTSSLFTPPDAIQPGDIILEDPWQMDTQSWWAGANYPL